MKEDAPVTGTVNAARQGGVGRQGRSPGGLVVRVWVEIYPLKPAQAQASRATFPTYWGRKGSRLWCITRLVEIDAAAAGCPQHRMDSPAAWSSLAALQTA
jgi:hypothetical protein